jgi:hypothetical protein
MREEGAREFVLSFTGTSHQRLDFVVDGFAGHFTFASTPGGSREMQNACAAARRKVRVVRENGLKASEELEEISPRWRAEPGSRLAQLRSEPTEPLMCTGSSGNVAARTLMPGCRVALTFRRTSAI